MITTKRHTDELVQAPRKVERATCPKCNGRIEVKRVYGVRILQCHHDPAKGFEDWCSGSDMNLDEDARR